MCFHVDIPDRCFDGLLVMGELMESMYCMTSLQKATKEGFLCVNLHLSMWNLARIIMKLIINVSLGLALLLLQSKIPNSTSFQSNLKSASI